MVNRETPSREGFVGAGLDTGAGWPFVQERLALLGKTVFARQSDESIRLTAAGSASGTPRRSWRRRSLGEQATAALQSRLQEIALATPWTRERAERWWGLHAPGVSASRPVADMVLSQEARPLRVIRQARN